MSSLTIFGAITAQLEFAKYAVEVPWYIVILLACLLAFPLTFAVIPSLTNFARVKNLFDTPNERASHNSAVPTLGGVAVFLGMVLPITLFGDLGFDHDFKYIIAGLLVLFFAGIKDDILIISVRTKLIAELLAIFIVVFLGNIRITDFHGFLGIHELPYFVSILFTSFMFVVVINGFNLIDGIDGLASGVGMISLSGLGIWFILSEDLAYAAFCFSTVAALAAFFRFNVFSKTNKIFLGDTGSLIIGMVATLFTIQFMEGSLTHALGPMVVSAPAIAIALLIFPLIDTLRVFTLRICLGRSPFEADRMHLHHKMLDLGLNHIQSTALILGFNLAILGMAVALRHMGNLKLLGFILPTAVILTSLPGMILRYNKRRSFISEAETILEKESKEPIPNGWLLPDTLVYLVNGRSIVHNGFPIHLMEEEGMETAADGLGINMSNDDGGVETEIEVYPD